MSLKNLMEDKQLDFNQPLLSVRRNSSKVGSGKDVKRKTNYSRTGVPPLPSYKSELKSGPVRNAGTVPFTWEQSPGRPKDESKSQTQPREQPPVVPKLPPGRIMEIKQQDIFKGSEDLGKVPSSSQSVSSTEVDVTKFENSKDKTQEEEDSDDGDEAYLDALDTLSRAESSFLNCSMSGLSGLDGPEVKPSRTFSTDPQTRDFMMGRFLPAARAMTSETPQYGSWKQSVVKEQPRQLRQIINGDKKPPVYPSRPNILPSYAVDNKEEESEDEDDDYDETGHLSTKGCGLLPRFCLKGSLCLLNPVPGLSVRTRVPMSRASRMDGRSSSSGSSQDTENQRMRVSSNEQRSTNGPQRSDLHGYNGAIRNKYSQVPQSCYQKLEGSSLYKRLQGNELPQSSFSEKKRFLDYPKVAEIDEVNRFSSQQISFEELLADQSTKRELGSASPVVEKTLYVDSIHKVVSPRLKSFSSDWQELPNSINKDSKIIAKFTGLEEISSDSLLEAIEKSNVTSEDAILQPKSSNLANSSVLSYSGKLDQQMGIESLKGSAQDQDLYKDKQKLTEEKKSENSQETSSQFPLPPPLPKSPSESWLGRTLPSMSTKNSSSRTYVGTRMTLRHETPKTPSVDTKWETIVKTTKDE